MEIASVCQGVGNPRIAGRAAFYRTGTGRLSTVQASMRRTAESSFQFCPSPCRRKTVTARTATDVDAPLEKDSTERPFNWYKHWWPVQYTYNLDTDRPNKIQLMGEFFVAWKAVNGGWVVMKDMCPHRLAPLSEGRVEEDGTLMCSYHGWRFNECGKCVHIPQADDEKSHATACNDPRSAAKTYPCKDYGTLLWIWPDDSDDAFEEAKNAPIAIPDEVATYLESRLKQGVKAGFARFLPYNHDVLVENILDVSHVPFAHHGVVPGLTRGVARAVPMKPIDPKFPNASMTVERPGRQPGGETCLHFIDRCLVFAENPSTSPERSRGAILLWTAPVADGKSLCLSSDLPEGSLSGHQQKLTLKSAVKIRFPALLHFSKCLITDGDNSILHFQDSHLREKRSDEREPAALYYTPASADYLVTKHRKWVATQGGGGPFGSNWKRQPGQMSRRDLLDRYETHTMQCKECQKALLLLNRVAGVLKMLSLACLVTGGGLFIRAMQTRALSKWQATITVISFAVLLFFERHIRQKIIPLFHFVDYVHAEKN